MTPTTTKGIPSLEESQSYQLFNQSGPSFPVFNRTVSIISTSTPGELQASSSDGTNVTVAVVDVSTANGLYDYVVLTDGPAFTIIRVLTRLVPTAQQNARLASFLSTNGYFRNVVDVQRPDNCQYANGIAPNVVPSSPPDAAAPRSSNRDAIIAGSVVGGAALASLVVC